LPDSNSAPRHQVSGWRWPLAAVVVFCLGGIVAIAITSKWDGSLRAAITGAATNWVEIAWPFPIDEWGRGKALHCPAVQCAGQIELYLRPKIGFCRCTDGVADDFELDRVSDFGLMGDDIAPVGEGRPIRVGPMAGRARIYRIGQPDDDRIAISAAFSNNCDVIVATAIVDRHKVVVAQPLALEFLGSEYVLAWAKHELGL